MAMANAARIGMRSAASIVSRNARIPQQAIPNSTEIVDPKTPSPKRSSPAVHTRSRATSNVPESVQWLLSNNIDVPANLILTTIDWQYVLQPGALGANLQLEVERDYKRIQMFKEKKYVFKPAQAAKIFEKFHIWAMMVIPQNVLSSFEHGGKEMAHALQQLTQDNSITLLQERMDRVHQKLIEGDIDTARNLAERIEHKADQFNSLIETYRTVWENEQVTHRQQILDNCKAAGSILTVAIAFPHMDASKAIALAGSYLRLGLLEWLNSPKCSQYLAKADTVRLQQAQMIYQLNDAIDEAMFAQ